MRIIGGHDYYDIGMGAGHDDHVLFAREKSRTLNVVDACRHGLNAVRVNLRFVEISSGNVLSRHSAAGFQHDGFQYDAHLLSVVLGDRQYSGIRIRRSPFMRHSRREDICFWSLDSLRAWLGKFGVRAVDRRDEWYLVDDQAVPLDAYFEVRRLPKLTVDHLLAQKMTLLTFMGEGDWDWDRRETRVFWRVNADDLKSIQFYKALDAYSIFQELEMWLGGVAAQTDNPVVVITDDRMRRGKHGFDAFGFRKVKRRA
jgi:hypothetical protein